MTQVLGRRFVSRVVMVVGGALLLPGALSAQGGQGFLFGSPSISVGIRSGYAIPRAGSEVFDFTREQLTVDKSDFNGSYVGGEVAIRVGTHLDVALGIGHASSRTRSEFRDWVDTDDRPIEQTTRFTTTPATLSAKYYLGSRGRSIGRFAWIPSRVTPYVGGGAGLVWYSFTQDGSFVEFETLDVFNTVIRTNGLGPQLHALGGVDVSIHKSLFLTGEARYAWATGEIDSSYFEGFDAMDLSGVQFTVGLSARF